MADYTEKRASALARIAQLETDAKTLKAGKADRAKNKLVQAKETLARIEAKQSETNGSPPKAKATKTARRAKK